MKCAIGIGIELHKNEVPDLDALGAALVDQRAVCIAAGREINVDFRARAEGPVSPIIQKLSFLLPLTIWILGSNPAFWKMPAQTA